MAEGRATFARRMAVTESAVHATRSPPVRAADLDYDLPEDLVAQSPPEERDGARLMVVARHSPAPPRHARVRELPRLLKPALFVVNDTRVIPARLFARKPTGGRVEVLLVERLEAGEGKESWLALARGTKSLREGTILSVDAGEPTMVVREIRDGGNVVLELIAKDVRAAIAKAGRMPLPPYIRRDAEATDASRYQTVFAAREGSVAAPTAGLHFSERLLAELEAAGHRLARVTLHVGPGTFAPLRSDDLDAHVMHAEHYEVSAHTASAIRAARAEGRPVIAVGTTVVRTLESSLDEEGQVVAGAGSTSIFIRPPHGPRAIDGLVTNFHLPRSTLLALVMAFAGIDETRRAYAEAVASRYRFFSYGDAMLIADPSLLVPS